MVFRHLYHLDHFRWKASPLSTRKLHGSINHRRLMVAPTSEETLADGIWLKIRQQHKYSALCQHPLMHSQVKEKRKRKMPGVLDGGGTKIYLVARIAASPVGRMVSALGTGNPSLHVTLVIEDPYEGWIGIDGQPDPYFKIDGFLAIKSNFYEKGLPSKLIQNYPEIMLNSPQTRSIEPPSFMSANAFGKQLVKNAKNFTQLIVPYSAPKNIGGNIMRPGEYNSSSYVAGLLKSVIGHVPEISWPGCYQTPGWENPIPSEYFTGSAP